MEWQEIIVTPLFWIVSTVGTIVISILANLLTPYSSAFVTRHLHARRTGLRDRQQKRRDRVIMLEQNIHRRTSTKIDVLFQLLLAMVLLLTCLFLFQLNFGALHESSIPSPSPTLEVPTFILIAMVLIIVMVLIKTGLDAMSLALTADRRERAREDFTAQHELASADEIRQFEDEWDLKTFGVNSQPKGPA